MRTDALVGPTARPSSRPARFRRAAVLAAAALIAFLAVCANAQDRRLKPPAAPAAFAPGDFGLAPPSKDLDTQPAATGEDITRPGEPAGNVLSLPSQIPDLTNRENLAPRAADRRPAHRPVARAGDPGPLHELHAHRHRPVAAAASDGHAEPSAQPGAGRPRAVHDVPSHGADVEPHQRRGGSAVPRRRNHAAGRPRKVRRAAAGVHDRPDPGGRQRRYGGDVPAVRPPARAANLGRRLHADAHPVVRVERAEGRVLDGFQGLFAVPDHRHGDQRGADQHGHDDAAAGC